MFLPLCPPEVRGWDHLVAEVQHTVVVNSNEGFTEDPSLCAKRECDGVDLFSFEVCWLARFLRFPLVLLEHHVVQKKEDFNDNDDAEQGDGRQHPLLKGEHRPVSCELQSEASNEEQGDPDDVHHGDEEQDFGHGEVPVLECLFLL